MLQIASAADASSPPDPKALHFACALARQCFVNEHVFATTDDEAAAARQLRDNVIAALASGAAIPELWLAVVATYYPLGTLPGADALLNKTWSEALSGVLTQQLREPATEAELRATIPALTPIEDDVSHKVQQQYEENPYPRWTKVDPPKQPVRFDQYMRNRFPAANFRELGKGEVDVLIAGCGTGQQAIETAPRYSGRSHARSRSQPDQPGLCAAQDPGTGCAEPRICPGRYSEARRDRPDLRRHRVDRRAASSRRPVCRLARAAVAVAAGRLHGGGPVQ